MSGKTKGGAGPSRVNAKKLARRASPRRSALTY